VFPLPIDLIRPLLEAGEEPGAAEEAAKAAESARELVAGGEEDRPEVPASVSAADRPEVPASVAAADRTAAPAERGHNGPA
jgi:hypothetical protein